MRTFDTNLIKDIHTQTGCASLFEIANFGIELEEGLSDAMANMDDGWASPTYEYTSVASVFGAAVYITEGYTTSEGGDMRVIEIFVRGEIIAWGYVTD